MNHTIAPVNATTLSRRLTTFLHAVLFVLGFSLVSLAVAVPLIVRFQIQRRNAVPAS